jgi:nucleoside recognition membrane protein YjiH
MIQRFNPAVPRHFLYAIAGLFWTLAGGLLCMRGAFWLGELQFPTIASIGAASIAVAAAGYVFLFAGIVRKNITRIGRLPDRACVFAFTAWRGYIMIAIMMTAGISLRSSSIPLYYLSLPYTAMGGILLTGSVVFYRQFLAVALPKK